MSMTSSDVLKMVKDNEAKFVDFRFTDTKGKEQHVSVPVSQFGQEKFDDGHAFDGSSIGGWKGIEASDMLLMPDANTAFIDPFREETTICITCDVVEPADRATNAIRVRSRDARRPTSSRRASATRRTSGPSRSSSSSTRCAGASTCPAAS